MRFLDKIRQGSQQQHDSDHPQQDSSNSEISEKPRHCLTYHFSFNENPGLLLSKMIPVTLRMRVSLVSALSECLEPGEDYQPSHEHLRAPPKFLASNDVNILNVKRAQDTLNDDLYLDLYALFKKIILTKRAYWEAMRQPLAFDDAHNDSLIEKKDTDVKPHVSRLQCVTGPFKWELNWVVDRQGSQTLAWELISTGRHCGRAVFLLVSHRHEPLAAMDWSTKTLFNISEDKLTSDFDRLQSYFAYVLQAEAVKIFIKDHREMLSKKIIPTPRVIDIRQESADIVPIVRCLPPYHPCLNKVEKNNAMGGIVLDFPMQAPLLCFLSDVAGGGECVWDGASLIFPVLKKDRVCELKKNFLDILNASQISGLLGREILLENNTIVFTCEASWVIFFTEVASQLSKAGFLCIQADGFPFNYEIANQWQVDVCCEQPGNALSSDTVDVNIRVGSGKEYWNFKALYRQIKQFTASIEGYRYANLEDGRTLLLPEQTVQRLTDEFENDFLSQKGNVTRLPLTQLARLNRLHDCVPSESDWNDGSDYLARAQKILDVPKVMDTEIQGLQATLRSYQWLGVCWLQHLRNCGASALLADDMGLGKTLQSIALFCLLRDAAQQQKKSMRPILVVMPRSLLNNWLSEIKRFAPTLRVLILHGPQRHDFWNMREDYPIILTTYSVLVKDVGFWQDFNLDTVVLDEAQNIKNPRTRVTQAVKTLNADFKVALSGTPIENNLGELWSIMDFLMPGMLGGQKSFKQNFRKPIEEQGSTIAMQGLLNRIQPYLLRRTKDQVVKDLPPKTEVVRRVILNDAQRAFYDDLKSLTRQEMDSVLEDNANNQGSQRILLISALLKLRQACCDPLLLGESIQSAKREYCIAMVESLVAEGRSVLIFSQFTTMLDLIAEDLQKKAIKYGLLTGKTQKRQEVVDDFQRADFPVFLISLKAGGVGLNLTQADTVIHFDPWWNVAAEQQATDRAYRIGQQKPVFVYKLIAEDTIEDRILTLQAQKQAFSEPVSEFARSGADNFALRVADLLSLWE